MGILTISTLLLMMMRGRPTLSGPTIIFVVFTDLKSRFFGSKKNVRRLSLHSLIVLSTSGVLILLGTIGILISAAVITIAVMAPMMSELGWLSHVQFRGRFLELFFEALSAFGTVGLSTGVTDGLSTAGRIILSVLMFTGRLGPMVIGIAVSRERTNRVKYAEENIMIG